MDDLPLDVPLLPLLSYGFASTYLKAYTHVKKIEVRTIVEIGAYQGFSSKIFRNLFPEATLYLVDPWKLYEKYLIQEAMPVSKKVKDYEDAYEKVKETFKNDRKTHILRMTSQKAAKVIPNGIDLVFIDGNHSYSYVKKDIQLWLPKVRLGGILSGHDYDPVDFKGVVKAVNEFFGNTIALGQDHTWIHLVK